MASNVCLSTTQQAPSISSPKLVRDANKHNIPFRTPPSFNPTSPFTHEFIHSLRNNLPVIFLFLQFLWSEYYCVGIVFSLLVFFLPCMLNAERNYARKSNKVGRESTIYDKWNRYGTTKLTWIDWWYWTVGSVLQVRGVDKQSPSRTCFKSKLQRPNHKNSARNRSSFSNSQTTWLSCLPRYTISILICESLFVSTVNNSNFQINSVSNDFLVIRFSGFRSS